MSDYLVRSRALIHIDKLIAELGGNADEYLQSISLNHGSLVAQDQYLPSQQYIKFLEYCAKELNCADFGLLLAKKQSFDVLGPLGLLIKHSPSIKHVLTAVQNFLAFHSQMEYWSYHQSASDLIVQRTDYFQGVINACQYKELAIGVSFRMSEKLLNTSKPIKRIEFSHAPISDIRVYRSFFNKPVYFNQERDALVFDDAILNWDLSDNNYDLTNYLAEYLAQLNQAYAHDAATLVKIYIQQSLGGGVFDINHIAQLMNMSKRTLQRRLDEKQQTFKQLLQETRMQLARWYLGSSKMSITQVASAVGYRDAGNFSRAFCKAHDCYPRAWQKQNKTQLQNF